MKKKKELSINDDQIFAQGFGENDRLFGESEQEPRFIGSWFGRSLAFFRLILGLFGLCCSALVFVTSFVAFIWTTIQPSDA